MFFIVFFFQAEDGIRDHCVTGVQTCALPICAVSTSAPGSSGGDISVIAGSEIQLTDGRSEERRVGKECRTRWSMYHLKINKLQFDNRVKYIELYVNDPNDHHELKLIVITQTR